MTPNGLLSAGPGMQRSMGDAIQKSASNLPVPDFDLEICDMEEGDRHGDCEDDKGQKGQQISEETHGGAYSLNGNSTKNAMT